MRISVLIPTRNRPFDLSGAAWSLVSRASGKHEVRYLVGCDADDATTIAMVWALRLRGVPLYPFVAKRQGSLGQFINMMTEAAPADVYTSLADDIECVTQDWDDCIASAWKQKPDGVWWWGCPTGTTFAIVSEKWRAAAGRVFTDYFPFWWDDCWLFEVYRFAAQEDTMRRLECTLLDKAVSTTRMRDLPFWTDFFWAMRPERIEEARRIAKRLGWPKVRETKPYELEPSPYFNPAKTEAQQGEKTPPTPEYLRAKARAEALMSNLERKAA